MSLEVFPALVAGLAGTLVMSAMMRLAATMGLTRMPPMHLVTGSMMSGDRETASKVGVMIHYVVMGTIVFGLAYAAAFVAFGGATLATGALLGIAHGLVVGLMAMPMMPAIHPRMSASPGGAGTMVVEGGQVSLTAPGIFGSRWGGMTPVGLVAGHLVYGLITAGVYSWLS